MDRRHDRGRRRPDLIGWSPRSAPALRTDTLTELRAEYAIETDDGERIQVSNFAVRSGDPNDIAKLVRSEPVAPERIYFRCSPRLEPAGERWSWLRSRILVGSGERHPGEVRLELFVVA